MPEADSTRRSSSDLPEQLVTTAQELTVCCEHLAAARRFGLDTEFVGEDTYHPRLCLVQVATDSRLYLIDPQTVGPLDQFWRLVVHPGNLVIVHAGREEIRLCRLWSGETPGNLFDLQIAAGMVGLPYPLSHSNLVLQVLGVRLPKGETLTEWRNRPLTPAQIRYAFDDVRYLLPLWERLSSRLDQLDRLGWAREEFDRLKVLSSPDETDGSPPSEKWRKLRGLGSLDRRRLAVVRGLFAWREETAAQTNRPSRTVVRDDLLVEIARRNPASARDLGVVRGLPRRSLDAIARVVQEARQLPLDQCPEVFDKEQDPPQFAHVTHLVSAVLGNFAVEMDLAPNLIASGQDIKLLVRNYSRGTPLPEGCLLAQGWRSAHVLPRLRALLEGRSAVRVRDVNSAAPFQITE